MLEMLVAMAIMVVVTGAIFQLAGSGQSGFRAQPEVADMQQRLRVAADMIYRDLLMAGAGPYQSPDVGALGNYFPAIRPARRGAVSGDGALTYASDRISIVFVPTTRAQTVVATAMTSAGTDIRISATEPGCPAGNTCGFALNTRALIFDPSGVGLGYDLFTVTGTGMNTLAHSSPNLPFTLAYAAGARVTEVEDHVYYLDTAGRRLMHYNGHQSDVPLVDNIAGLTFTYYADPNPMSAPQPDAGQANCVYDAGSPPVPRLVDLGGTALKPLTASRLTDGPTCGVGTNQFDGDLLRVRKIRVRIQAQVGPEDLRAGKTAGGAKYVPDYAVGFEVTPRNLNLVR
jgi:hypothetical protein